MAEAYNSFDSLEAYHTDNDAEEALREQEKAASRPCIQTSEQYDNVPAKAGVTTAPQAASVGSDMVAGSGLLQLGS